MTSNCYEYNSFLAGGGDLTREEKLRRFAAVVVFLIVIGAV